MAVAGQGLLTKGVCAIKAHAPLILKKKNNTAASGKWKLRYEGYEKVQKPLDNSGNAEGNHKAKDCFRLIDKNRTKPFGKTIRSDCNKCGDCQNNPYQPMNETVPHLYC